MLNNYAIAGICNALYHPQPKGFWDDCWEHDGGYAAHKLVKLPAMPAIDVIVWRGSTTVIDWLDDFQTLPVPDGKLGEVHEGFLRGIAETKADVDKVLSKDRLIVVTGHSLGAAHALLYAGHLVAETAFKPTRVVVFGAPRPGYQQLADVLKQTPIASYRNRVDPVTEVPFSSALFPFVDCAPLTALDVEPPPIDAWGPLADHHMALYLAGVGALHDANKSVNATRAA